MPNIVSLDRPASYWREKARQAERSGDYAGAIQLYRAALSKQEDNQTRREMANVYIQTGSYSVAERLLLKNLAEDAEDTDSLYALARSRSMAGDSIAMAQLLDMYLRLAPCGQQADQARDILWRMPRGDKNEEKRLRRAETLCLQARLADGKIDLKTAKKSWKRGETQEDAMLLAEAYAERKKPEKALEFAGKACKMAPESLKAKLLYCRCLALNGENCRSALDEAWKLVKSITDASEVCSTATMLGKAGEAASMMEKRLRKNPQSVDELSLLSNCLFFMKNKKKRLLEVLKALNGLDDGSSINRAMLDLTEHGDEEYQTADPRLKMLKVWEHAMELIHGNEEQLPAEEIGEKLLKMLELPFPGMDEATAALLIKTQDAKALRQLLTRSVMDARQTAVVLEILHLKGEKLPCFAIVAGCPCLLPGKERPPYDEDLHELSRRLLLKYKKDLPLELMVSELPKMWKKLPESARSHSGQGVDDVWTDAFAAYLYLKNGDADRAESTISAAKRPMRVGRAYMQLIRRSETIHEVY